MGANPSVGVDQDEEVRFVIPNSVELTVNQLRQLGDHHQQQGVAFSVNSSGIERSRGLQLPIVSLENQASICRSSVQMTIFNDSSAMISFTYQAKVSSFVSIYANQIAKLNVPADSSFVLDSFTNACEANLSTLIFGPYSLPPSPAYPVNTKGCNRLYYKPCHFQVFIPLKPIYRSQPLASEPVQIPVAANTVSVIVNNNNKKNGELSDPDFNKLLHKYLASQCVEGGMAPSSSSERAVPAVIDMVVVLQPSSEMSCPDTARSTNLTSIQPTFMSPGCEVSTGLGTEVTFYSILSVTGTDPSTTRPTSATTLAKDKKKKLKADHFPCVVKYKCEQQLGQVEDSMYELLDIFGIDCPYPNPPDLSKTSEETGGPGSAPSDIRTSTSGSTSPVVDSTRVTPRTPEEEGHRKLSKIHPIPPAFAPPTEPEEEEEEDDPNALCSICLTDPKEIVMMPCRHTCLCKTCSWSIAAQGNKCPICRSVGTLLFRVPMRMQKGKGKPRY